jgi:hypothetical protein
MDIEGENTSLAVEIEEGRPSATGDLARRSFNNPSFGKQLFDNKRDSTSLQSRSTGKVSSRDRLLGANLIEDQIAVDLASDSI